MKKILFIVPYFGKWPIWFPAFLRSCQENSDVNWLFLTDCAFPKSFSSNIEFIEFTLEEFSKLASQKLGFDVDVCEPKLACNMRPAFGVIFADYLEQYDFWGHCDVDVIFGNVKAFITDEVLSSYDVITSRRNKLAGHFTLYRNADKFNHAFELAPDYIKILSAKKNQAFDEKAMTDVVERLAHSGEIRVFWDKVLLNYGTPKTDSPGSLGPSSGQWYWKEGRLFDPQGEEIMYLHFMTWKKSMTNIFSFDEVKADHFYISCFAISINEPGPPPLSLVFGWYVSKARKVTGKLRRNIVKRLKPA